MTNLLHNFDYAHSEPAYSTVCMGAYAAAAGVVFAVRRVPDHLPSEYVLCSEGVRRYRKDDDYRCIGKGVANTSKKISFIGSHRKSCKSDAPLFWKKSIYYP